MLLVLLGGAYWVTGVCLAAEDSGASGSGSEGASGKEERRSGTTGAKMTPEEAAMFEAFEKLLEAEPNSAEYEALEAEFDSALAEVEEIRETSPDAGGGQLPAAPSRGTGTGVDAGIEPGARIRGPGAVGGRMAPGGAPDEAEDVELSGLDEFGEDELEVSELVEDLPGEVAEEGDDVDVDVEDEGVAFESGGPDDVVQLNIKDNMLDIDLLIEMIGREFEFTFLDMPAGVSGTVKLKQFGEIRRRDLLPLLESILSFKGFVMVREDPFIRIVPAAEVTKKTKLPVTYGVDMPTLEPGDSVITQIVELKYATMEDVSGLLGRFTDQALQPIKGTGYLIITDYAWRMPRLLEMIALLDQPGPAKRLEVMNVDNADVSEVAGQIEQLLKDLTGVQAGIVEEAAAPAAAAEPAAEGERPVRPSRRGQPAVQAEAAVSGEGGADYSCGQAFESFVGDRDG